MTGNLPTPPQRASRFAVPVEDLEAAHVSQAQMVELVHDSHRLPPQDLPVIGGPGADSDGD